MDLSILTYSAYPEPEDADISTSAIVGISTGAIVGIVLGVIVIVALMVGLIIWDDRDRLDRWRRG